MIEPISHEQEVIQLFKESTVEIPGIENVRAITLESFKIAIDRMMDQAYYYGINTAFSKAEGMVDDIINRAR
jgi:hypothetical protein